MVPATQNELRLPSESEMTRKDALGAFVEVVNVTKPDHPHHESPYPISVSDVDFGRTRTYLARCGPRSRRSSYKVAYATRMTYINNITREQHLALLTHEVTHIPVGRHSRQQGGSHPPRFWEEMAFHAMLVRDSLKEGTLAQIFPETDVAQYLQEVVKDPNFSTVDRRYWTVNECKDRLADLLGVTR